MERDNYLTRKNNVCIIMIISQYYSFYCIFDQIKATLVSIRDLNNKINKIMLTANF